MPSPWRREFFEFGTHQGRSLVVERGELGIEALRKAIEHGLYVTVGGARRHLLAFEHHEQVLRLLVVGLGVQPSPDHFGRALDIVVADIGAGHQRDGDRAPRHEFRSEPRMADRLLEAPLRRKHVRQIVVSEPELGSRLDDHSQEHLGIVVEAASMQQRGEIVHRTVSGRVGLDCVPVGVDRAPEVAGLEIDVAAVGQHARMIGGSAVARSINAQASSSRALAGSGRMPSSSARRHDPDRPPAVPSRIASPGSACPTENRRPAATMRSNCHAASRSASPSTMNDTMRRSGPLEKRDPA